MSWWLKYLRIEPPAAPTVCCQWDFQATFSCATLLWTVVLTGSTPDVDCSGDTDWTVTGDPLVYTRTVFTDGAACDVEPDPLEPFDGGIPPGSSCTCCQWDFDAVWNCDTDAWDVTLVDTTQDVACADDTDWIEDTETHFTKTMYTAPSDCSGDEPDPGEPPTPTDVCCCRWIYQATFDCDSLAWTVMLLSTDSNIACDSDTDWMVTGDVCVYTRTMYTADVNCSSGDPDPGQPFAGASPPSCCGDCCVTVWESEWDCNEAVWGTPVIASQAMGMPCDSDSGWVDVPDSNPTRVQYTQYSSPSDCSGAAIPVDPPSGTEFPPAQCCWTFRATYDCDLASWVVGVIAAEHCPSTCNFGDWTGTEDPCVYERIMVTAPGNCAEQPDPGDPGFVPDTCCPLCCRWEFRGVYNCITEAWDVTLDDSQPMMACDVDTDWTVDGADACTYLRTMYTVGNDCVSQPDPGQPLSGSVPPDCCLDCGLCFNDAQPDVVITGWPVACTSCNGNQSFSERTETDEACMWRWNGGGSAADIQVSYFPADGTWYVEDLGCGAIGSFTTDLSCVDGVITGTIIGSGNCLGDIQPVTIVFGGT